MRKLATWDGYRRASPKLSLQWKWTTPVSSRLLRSRYGPWFISNLFAETVTVCQDLKRNSRESQANSHHLQKGPSKLHFAFCFAVFVLKTPSQILRMMSPSSCQIKAVSHPPTPRVLHTACRSETNENQLYKMLAVALSTNPTLENDTLRSADPEGAGSKQ